MAARRCEPGGIEWRFVDGTARRTEAATRADIAWADVVVIWAPTRLAHTVSDLYTGSARHGRTAVCTRKGLGGFADAIAAALAG